MSGPLLWALSFGCALLRGACMGKGYRRAILAQVAWMPKDALEPLNLEALLLRRALLQESAPLDKLHNVAGTVVPSPDNVPRHANDSLPSTVLRKENGEDARSLAVASRLEYLTHSRGHELHAAATGDNEGGAVPSDMAPRSPVLVERHRTAKARTDQAQYGVSANGEIAKVTCEQRPTPTCYGEDPAARLPDVVSSIAGQEASIAPPKDWLQRRVAFEFSETTTTKVPVPDIIRFHETVLLGLLQLDFGSIHAIQAHEALRHLLDLDGLPLPTHIAVQIPGDLGLYILNILTDAGADFNQLDRDGRSPLMVAAALGRTPVVQWLLEHGAHIQAVDRYGQSALHYAARSNTPDVLWWLLAWGALPAHAAAPARKSVSPLHVVLRQENDMRLLDSVEALLHFYASPLQTDFAGVSVVEEAIRQTLVELTERLTLGDRAYPLHIAGEHLPRATDHYLFEALEEYFPEAVILRLLETPIQRHDTAILCLAVDGPRQRSLLWLACSARYLNVVHRLIQFYREARDNRYPGYEYCNPHLPGSDGYTPAEVLVVTHRSAFDDRVEAAAMASVLKRLLRTPDPIDDVPPLVQATCRSGGFLKVSSLTFASYSTSDHEAIFRPPAPLGMDDLVLTQATMPIFRAAVDSVTPLMAAVLNRQRRAQRLLFKAMTQSSMSNVNVLGLWKEQLRAMLESAEHRNAWLMDAASVTAPRLVQDILTLATPGDVPAGEIPLILRKHLPLQWYFSAVGHSALENAVWFDMSPFSSPTIPSVSQFLSKERVTAQSSADCMRALLGVHLAFVYFRRFRAMPFLAHSFTLKRQRILRRLFQSPILNVHKNVLIVSGLVVQAQSLLLAACIVGLFVATRFPVVAQSFRDPMCLAPQSAKGSWRFSLTAAVRNLAALHAWDMLKQWSVGPRFTWLTLALFRAAVAIRVLVSVHFWKARDLNQPFFGAVAAALVQAIFMARLTPPVAADIFRQSLDLFHIYPCEQLLELGVAFTRRPTETKQTAKLLRRTQHRWRIPQRRQRWAPWRPLQHRTAAALPHTRESNRLRPPDTRAPTTDPSERGTQRLAAQRVYVGRYESLVSTTVSRQFKVPAVEYFGIVLVLAVLAFLAAGLPHFGGVFLANYASVYADEHRTEVALRHSILRGWTFEWSLTVVLTWLFFTLFKPIGFALMCLHQRRRILEALTNMTPLRMSSVLGPDPSHDDTTLWHVAQIWTAIWRRALYRSSILTRIAIPLLNATAFVAFVLMLWLFHLVKMDRDIIRTRTGLMSLSFATCLVLLVVFAVAQLAACNHWERKSCEDIDALYSSCRFLSSDYDIFQKESAKVCMIDPHGLRLLGFHASSFCNRAVQVICIPAVLFLIVTAISVEAPSLYL